MKYTNKSAKTVGILLAGVAIGGAVGMLFAPEKGRRIRRRLSNSGEDFLEMMKVRFHGFLEDVKGKLERTSARANEFLEIEKALNSKIIKMTMKIQNECPELSKYMEEMTDTIPANISPEITLKNLKTYSDSLESMYKKYMKEHKISNN